MQHDEAVKLIFKLASAYPRTPMQEATQATYAENLLDLTGETAGAVIDSLIRTSKWLPSIAEIRAAAVEIADDGGLPSAEEAWEEVVSNLSYYHEPRFSHPLIARVARMVGGTKQLAIMPLDKLPFERNKFLELYATMRTKAVDDQRAGRVALPDAAEAKSLIEHIFGAADKLKRIA